MSYSFALEWAYLSKEFSRAAPSQVRVIGTLLDSAFQRLEPDPRFGALLHRLSSVR